MPRYFFDVINGQGPMQDDEGLELPSPDAIRKAAARIAFDIARDEAPDQAHLVRDSFHLRFIGALYELAISNVAVPTRERPAIFAVMLRPEEYARRCSSLAPCGTSGHLKKVRNIFLSSHVWWGRLNQGEITMIKLITTSVIVLGLATSASFAQSSKSSNTDAQAGSGGTVQTQTPGAPAPAMKMDNTTTNSTSGGNASGGGAGLSGTSAAGTNEKCPAGTPGAGVNSAPSADAAATNPACNGK